MIFLFLRNFSVGISGSDASQTAVSVPLSTELDITAGAFQFVTNRDASHDFEVPSKFIGHNESLKLSL